MSLADLPDGWSVWTDEGDTVVLVYRPDVFDTAAFPAPCLPTIYLTKGKRDRRPGPNEPDPDDPWYVTLFLEPDVEKPAESAASRAAAEDVALGVAKRFVRGTIDFRGMYQVPREDYLDRLAELVG
jgi:hypothetical protein